MPSIAIPFSKYSSNAMETEILIWRHATQTQAISILILYSPDTDVYNTGLGLVNSTVETAFYDRPLVQQSLRLSMQSQHFSSPGIQRGRHFLNSPNALAAVYTDILHLCCSKFTKGGSKLTQAYNKVHVYSTVVPYSGTFTCKWLCACKIWWSLVKLAGSPSPQRLFCTE